MSDITRNHDASSRPSGGARTHFGGFPAAVVLQERVRDCGDNVSRRVGRLLQDYNEGLGMIYEINNGRVRRRIALMWRDDFLRRAQVHPYVDDYLKNVISSFYKVLERE